MIARKNRFRLPQFQWMLPMFIFIRSHYSRARQRQPWGQFLWGLFRTCGGFTLVNLGAGVGLYHRLIPHYGAGPAKREIRGTDPSPKKRGRAGGSAARPRL